MKNLSKQEMQEIRGGLGVQCSHGDITGCTICNVDLELVSFSCMYCPGWGLGCTET